MIVMKSTSVSACTWFANGWSTAVGVRRVTALATLGASATAQATAGRLLRGSVVDSLHRIEVGKGDPGSGQHGEHGQLQHEQLNGPGSSGAATSGHVLIPAHAPGVG